MSSAKVALHHLFVLSRYWMGNRTKCAVFCCNNEIPKIPLYIFMDDDVVLHFNSFASPQIKRLPPFRVFEQWLLDYEPVVGVVDYEGHHGAIWTNERRKKICSKTDSPL